MGLGGLGQIAGRLGYRWLVDATSVRVRGVVILLATAATTGLMAVVPGPTAPAPWAGAAPADVLGGYPAVFVVIVRVAVVAAVCAVGSMPVRTVR